MEALILTIGVIILTIVCFAGYFVIRKQENEHEELLAKYDLMQKGIFVDELDKEKKETN